MISIRAYAASRGISHVAVLEAIKRGRLRASVTKDDKGRHKIADAALADQEWAANTDQSKPTNRVTGQPKINKPKAPGEVPRPLIADKPKTPTPKAEIPPEVPLANQGPNYAQSRAVREAYMARLAKLEFDEKSGKAIQADEVRIAIFNTGRKARDMLLAVPDRVAPLVVGQTDAHEIHRILMDEMRRVCAEIAKMKLAEAEA